MQKNAQLLIILLLLSSGAAGQVSIYRELQSSAAPGDRIAVTLIITAESGGGLIIRESIPPGWSVLSSSPAGYFNQSQGIIKWVFLRGPPEKVEYTIAVPADASGSYTINGSWISLSAEGEVPASRLKISPSAAPVAEGTAAALSALAVLAVLIYLLRRR